jgi:hypothetical protein
MSESFARLFTLVSIVIAPLGVISLPWGICCDTFYKINGLLGENFTQAQWMGDDGVFDIMSFLKALSWKPLGLTFIT